MKKVIILHGAQGNPEENWFPWLADKLRTQGLEVLVPQLPIDENQKYEIMKNIVLELGLDEDTVLIGHSLGGLLALLMVSREDIKLAGIICVATPINLGDQFNIGSEAMFNHPENINWKRIRNNVGNKHVFESDNDPYISFGTGQEISENIDAEYHLVKNAGHFNSTAGFDNFPQLLAMYYASFY